ncbi:hypothetical protein G7Y89_g6818 [Cudoniella acicularis]|uniref:Letm1 RBD domain-containing protein n=1 Tax=Cudoniella acicularis TaxID=354080 RepID=A0A8H4W4E4_9HELO|nr:hypothetical protein G7Y89_g6818 [Cudoniella acicularis]
MTTLTTRGLRTASLFQRAHSTSFQPQFLSSQLSLQFRPASSSAATSSSTAPLRSPLNGPLSTLPASLALPIRSEHESTFKYLLALGKAYANFYKTGGKHIFTNFRASQPIQALIDNEYRGSIRSAVSSGALSRSDFQLLYRSWHDVKRVPIFALVFIICGEFTPLVVIALSNVVPWTCRIPKQIDSDRKKLEDRRRISFRNLTTAPPEKAGVEGLERQQLVHISWSLGLSSSIWDWLGGKYPGLPNAILRRKVRNTVEYLEMDDGLIGKPHRVKELETEEVRMALVERGVDILGKSEEKLRVDLIAWLQSRQKAPVEQLLLTR